MQTQFRKNDWIWMPHPAHFICAHSCRFILATYIPNSQVIVSTVGEYVPDSAIRQINWEFGVKRKELQPGDAGLSQYLKARGFDEVGCDRTFEAKPSPKKVFCCPYEIIVSEELDFNGYNEAGDAHKGHFLLCEEYDKRKKTKAPECN